MKRILAALCLAWVGMAAQAAETTSALTCADFNPTAEALARFPDLIGACEGVVERNGELYGVFRAVVRRAGSRSVTLYLPATDHTFSVEPRPEARVLIDGRKVRPRNVDRGSEVRIYLSSSAFATPVVQEIALLTDDEAVIEHPVVPASALPTTASHLPNLVVLCLAMLGLGYALRWYRLRLRDQALKP